MPLCDTHDQSIYTDPNRSRRLKDFDLASLQKVHVSNDDKDGFGYRLHLETEVLHKVQLETLHTLELSVYLLLLKSIFLALRG